MNKESANVETGLVTNSVASEKTNMMLLSVVILLLVISALGVIYSSYKSRQLFSQLQQHGRETLRLEEQWGRLLLEQSTWASHERIEGLAKSKLNMLAPTPDAMILVDQ